jgi:hypothetical protein
MARPKRACKFCGSNTNAAGERFRSLFAFLGHQGRCAKNPKRLLPPKQYGNASGLETAAKILEARGRELLRMAQEIRAVIGAG